MRATQGLHEQVFLYLNLHTVRSMSRICKSPPKTQGFHEYQISSVNAHTNDLRINLFISSSINEASVRNMCHTSVWHATGCSVRLTEVHPKAFVCMTE